MPIGGARLAAEPARDAEMLTSDEPWIAAVRDHIRERRLADGCFLFRQGDPVFGIFAVTAGRLRLVRHAREGSLCILHVATAGETFAEAALFSDVYHCDAVANVPSAVMVIPKDTMLRAFSAEPAIATAFMARLARQVQSLRSRLEVRNIRSAAERVVQYLLLASRADRPVIVFDRPWKDVAAEIGLTHEALYRTLSTLEAEGRIVRRGREIALLTPAGRVFPFEGVSNPPPSPSAVVTARDDGTPRR